MAVNFLKKQPPFFNEKNYTENNKNDEFNKKKYKKNINTLSTSG